MRRIVLVVALVACACVVRGDSGWGQFGANSGPFTTKPFYGGLENFGSGYGVGLTSFPDSMTIIGGHALALDGFAATQSSPAAGLSASLEKVPNPRDWVGVIIAGPDKWSGYLKVMLDF